jgi:hypothetical protein
MHRGYGGGLELEGGFDIMPPRIPGPMPLIQGPMPIRVQPWLPIVSWQCCRISVRHSDMDLSDRRQAAICSCRVAIFSRISLVGVYIDEAGGLAANAALLIAISKAPVIEAIRQAELEDAMTLSFVSVQCNRGYRPSRSPGVGGRRGII